MKKIFSILMLVVSMQQVSFPQNPCDVFNANEIIWYGIDFSMTKMVGTGFTTPSAIKATMFPSWNNLILTESKKYDIKKFLHKSSVQFNLAPVTDINNKVDESKMLVLNSSESNELKEADIKMIVSQYTFDKNSGIGVLLIADSFNKVDETGHFLITFIDLVTKQVLVSKKITGKAGGIGLRNYWAGSIFAALKSCEPLFNGWKKEFCKN